MTKSISILIFIVFIQTTVHSQSGENYQYLKKYILSTPNLKIDSSNFLSIYHNKALHYLYPLYKSISQEKKLIENLESFQFYSDVSESFAFTGDYHSALEAEKKSFDSVLEDSIYQAFSKKNNLLEGVSFKDAKKYILENCVNKKVVMINESHNKPLHRAFEASLLDELYALGFRYLAMETLNIYPNASLKQVNVLTGHYTCEPIGGELVRKAIQIGFILVPYDDSVYQHSINQREFTQAENINKILQKDPTAKIIVLAGDRHIEETASGKERIPMAAYFKNLSGIDPLTIDQTLFTEQSISEYGSAIYQFYTKKNSFVKPAVVLKTDSKNDSSNQKLFDIYVLHPVTKYKNGRPTWNSINGLRKEVAVQPIFQTLFLVQAFYEKEYQEKLVGRLVPADQTYISAPDGYNYLYLQKGKYHLVYRDMQYKILGSKPLIVE